MPGRHAARLVARLNDITTVGLLVSSAVALQLYGDLERIPPLEATSVTWSFCTVGFIALTACVFELGWICSGHITGLLTLKFNGLEQLHGDSKLMVFLYGAIATTYLSMAFLDRGQVIHVHRLSVGTKRPVYTLRYVEWMVASATLVWITGRNVEPDTRQSLAASTRLSSAYIVASWVACVIAHPHVACFLFAAAFVGYLVASLEQLLLARRMYGRTACCRIQSLLLVYTVLFYGLYGIVWVLAIFDIVSPEGEQHFYTWGDITVKLGVSMTLIMLRRTEDGVVVRGLEAKALTLANDLSRLIKTASVPIFGVSAEGAICEWNDKMADLTHLSHAEAMGSSFIEKIQATRHQEIEDILRECFQGHTTSIVQLHLARRSAGVSGHPEHEAKPITLMVSVTPKLNSDGDIVEVIGVGQDLTEIAAVKEEAELRKSRFLAAVSHELRSPLHGIIGLSEALAASESNAGRAKQLIMVKNCATRLLDLVVSIMDFSVLATQRREGGQRTYKLSRDLVELPKILDEVMLLIRNGTDKQGRHLLRPGVALLNQAERGMPIIQADAHKCTQVFYNLVANACKFTKRGEVKITSILDPSRKYVEVVVADTGKGIAPEALKKIFEPFEREDDPDLAAHEGIGLGLSISKEVVTQHGGDISIESEVGVGTTCTIRLPMIMVAQGDDTCSDGLPTVEDLLAPLPPEAAASSGAGLALKVSLQSLLPPPEGPTARRPLVLSVDDDIVNQTVIKSLLGDLYEVHAAMSGKECLSFFATHARTPDVVLLDVMMPGMSGFEVCKAIREDLRLSNAVLPIVMLSARSPLSLSTVQGLSAGCNDYIAKPFDREVLQARVRNVLQIKDNSQGEVEHARQVQKFTTGMPPHIARRLQAGESTISESHGCVTILFSEIVGLEGLQMSQFIALLNEAFAEFDSLTEEYGVYRVEGFGDTYMCAAGHDGSVDHATRMVLYGLALIEAAARIPPVREGVHINVKVGVHSGPVLTGIVGQGAPRYCFFGDTVSIACRMESHGLPGLVHLSQRTREALDEQAVLDAGAQFIEQGTVDIKGQGTMSTHLVIPPGVGEPVVRRCSKKKRTLCEFNAVNPPSSSGEAPLLEGAGKTPAQWPADVRTTATSEVDALRAAVSVEQELVAAMRSELEAARAEAARVDQQLRARDEALRERSGELAAASDACAELRGRLTVGAARERELDEQLRAAQAQVATSERHGREVQERLEVVGAELMDVKAKHAVLAVESDQKCSLHQRLSMLEEERDAWESAHTSLQKRLNESDSYSRRCSANGGCGKPTALNGHVAAICKPARSFEHAPEALPAEKQPLLSANCFGPPSEGHTGLHALLESKEQELEHLRLELRLKEQQLRTARMSLANLTLDSETRETELHHALLDLRQASVHPSSGGFVDLGDIAVVASLDLGALRQSAVYC